MSLLNRAWPATWINTYLQFSRFWYCINAILIVVTSKGRSVFWRLSWYRNFGVDIADTCSRARIIKLGLTCRYCTVCMWSQKKKKKKTSTFRLSMSIRSTLLSERSRKNNWAQTRYENTAPFAHCRARSRRLSLIKAYTPQSQFLVWVFFPFLHSPYQCSAYKLMWVKVCHCSCQPCCSLFHPSL